MKKKAIIALILTFVMTAVIALPSCGKIDANNLMSGIVKNNNEPGTVQIYTNEEIEKRLANFAVELFKASFKEGENTLVSPLSVLSALAMTANGSAGNTREEFNALFGSDIENLNGYISNYLNTLPENEYYKLNLANSIWFTDDERFTVNEDFLQLNANYYGADIFEAPFDNATKDDINSWVEEKTAGMIKNLIDEIPEDAIMYLVNALAFDAEWQNSYKKDQLGYNTFTTKDGVKREVEFMYGAENTLLTDDNAEGFIKYYWDRKYAFAALLPDEGVSVADYVKTLSGEKILKILGSAEYKAFSTWLPKFESEYSCEMSEVLKSMGLVDAFSGSAADFSKLGGSVRGNIFINRVLHKTFISVDERGTKAGAATAVEITDECAMEGPDKEIRLDRPFVYMLIDCETNLPFFIGTVMDIE